MIDRERLKIRIDFDKMEKIIKNHVQVKYHKICFLEKDKLSQVIVEQSIAF